MYQKNKIKIIDQISILSSNDMKQRTVIFNSFYKKMERIIKINKIFKK